MNYSIVLFYLCLYHYFIRNKFWILPNNHTFFEAPCAITTYIASARQFKLGSGLLSHSITNLPPTDENSKLKVVTITYQEGVVLQSEHKRLVSVHNFISQIGGNLGLFLGFSCLSTILSFYSLICRCKHDIKINSNITAQEAQEC